MADYKLTQIGQDIDGENLFDYSGNEDTSEVGSLSISADGSIVAIGARGNDGTNGENSGHVRIYQNNSGTWQQIGSDINGQQPYNDQGGFGVRSGISVSLSDNGNVVAIGGNGWQDYDGDTHGELRLFENNDGNWQQLGETISRKTSSLGQRCSLSGDGSVLAVSEWGGSVEIYERNGNSWTKTKEFTGSSGFGYSISLSEDGNVIAIGALYADSERGAVHVYKKNSNNWDTVGQINGEASGDRSGSSVRVSDDGTNIAIGAPWNDGGGNKAGQVRVYKIEELTYTISCLLYTSPSPRDQRGSRMPSSA